MRSVEETTVLVTGATDGLGRRVAHDLANRGATVLVHGRNRQRGAETVDELRTNTGNPHVHLHLAELSDLAQVAGLGEEIKRQHPVLHVLINNAGIGPGLPAGREREESRDGYELRFAVNYLAGYLLTDELLPLLRASALSRIVNVASLGQYEIDFDDVMLTHSYDGWRAYRQSKLAQIMSTIDMAERLATDEVTVNSLHPGTFMPTKIVTSEIGHPVDSLETGTANVVRLAAAPELDGVTGRFFDGDTESRANPQVYNAPARQQLREFSDQLIKNALGEQQ